MDENRRSTISQAESDEQIGEFWDTHNFTDFDDPNAPDIEMTFTHIMHKYVVNERVRAKKYEREGTIASLGSVIGGTPFYNVDLGDSTPTLIGERDLERAMSPFRELIEQNYGRSDDFDLLTRSKAIYFAYHYEEWSCLSNARLDPKPYQIFVAHRVLQDLYPRYILADEVGLGKTIEAGLILKELKARGLAERILIITPASLREQWQGELKTKFNERFHIYDSATIKENRRRYLRQNPWEGDNYIITSIQFARRQVSGSNEDSETDRWLDEVDWDLVIFDEAHHLRRKLIGRKVEPTKAYRLGQTLAEKTKSLLLLTATPMQLSGYEAFSLIELVDSNLFASYDEFDEHLALRKNEDWQSIMKVLSELNELEVQADDMSEVVDRFTRINQILKTGLPIDFWNTFKSTCLKLSIQETQSMEKELGDLKTTLDFLVLQQETKKPWVEMIEYAQREAFSIITKYYEAIEPLSKNLHRLSRIMIRNRKREVLKGEIVERRAYKVEVTPTPEEAEFYRKVSTYIKEAYASTSKQKNNAVSFVLTIFRKLLVSSPLALAASLEKRADRIEEAVQTAQKSKDITEDEIAELDETIESIEELDELFNLIGTTSAKKADEEITQLRNFATQARTLPTDSKANKLLTEVNGFLQDNSSEKVLIFTQFLETQNYLKSKFEDQGYQVAIFRSEKGHSNYSKRGEFDRFKKDSNVQIMISTEVGGEGLNLQFCHILFNYDLPWNPMRIEQRIGRLDRIGQKQNVHIYNFFLADTLDSRILDVLQNRVRIFEETIGNLDPILGDDIESRIRDMLLADESEAEQKLVNLEELVERRLDEARKAEKKMADFVMDRQSFRQDTVNRLLSRKPPVTNQDIEQLIKIFLARYPHEDLFKSEGTEIYNISVPERFRQECRYLFDIRLHRTYKGTFDPTTAIQEDTIDFFAFGHPLVDAVIEYCTNPKKHGHFRSQTALRILDHPEYTGYEGVQFNYILTFNGILPYKKLVSIVINQEKEYDEEFSDLVSSLNAKENLETEMSSGWTLDLLEDLHKHSLTIVEQIVHKELQDFRERNTRNFEGLKTKTLRIFDYRLRDQNTELKQRKERLEYAQRRKQRIIPAREGQVKATERRIEELEHEREIALTELQNQKESYFEGWTLLNIAYVKFI